MIKIKQAIVVEGRYDKNTLSQVVDAPIFQTDGFGIMKAPQQMALLRKRLLEVVCSLSEAFLDLTIVAIKGDTLHERKNEVVQLVLKVGGCFTDTFGQMRI